jgi:hypothetical protein
MLPDSDRQLLTAYVDGELSSRQRRQVVRLLQRSRDARHLLRSLQEDARALGSISAPKLDCDLSASVLQSIRERRLTPGRRRLKPLQPAFPAWVGIAVAASVMCVIGLASYMGFAAFVDHSGKKAVDPVASQEPPAPKDDQPANAHNVRPEDKRNDKPEVVQNDKTPPAPDPDKFVGPPFDGKIEKDPPAVVKKDPPEKDPVIPPPDSNPMKDDPMGDRLTAPAMERFKLEMVEGAAKPVILKLHDLDQDPVLARLAGEVSKAPGFRLELPCDNGTRAFERLQAACKDQKIAVLIDQKAQQRLKDPKAKTNYVLYVENLTPEELTRFVQGIGAEDRKAAAKKPADAHFDRLVVTRLTKRDYKELSDLLGIDPSHVEPTGPLGTDLRKPLSDQTADQLAKLLSGEKPTAKPDGQQALVLAYNPVLPPKNSPEVKKFLDTRKPAKPGTVRAILVLRST